MERQETRFSITQVTSLIASVVFDFSDRPWVEIHHPRDTTMRNNPSLPPSSKYPQSFPVVSPLVNGQFSVLCHFGCVADHHSIHLSLKSSSMAGMFFFPNRRPCLNHQAISSGRGSVGNLDDPYRNIISE